MHVQALTRSDPIPADSSAVQRVADVLRSRSAKPRVFVIDDPENIAEAVRCGIVLESVYFAGRENDMAVADLCAGLPDDVTRYVLADGTAERLFGPHKHSRIFALARAPRARRLSDVTSDGSDFLVLDGVRLAGNIGAIVRTASALGAAGVVALESGLPSPWDRRLIRASRGQVFALPLVLERRARFAVVARRDQIPVAALSADARMSLAAVRDVPGRLALVLGGERGGVSTEILNVATHRVSIPMAEHVESLNVSVTAGIALHARSELHRG